MKRFFSLILVLAMMLLTVPAFAETGTEEMDLSSLLGSLFSGDGESGEGGDMSSIMGLLGGLGGEDSEGGGLSSILGLLGSLSGGDSEGGGLSSILGLLGSLGGGDGEGGGLLSSIMGLLGSLGSEDGEGADMSGLLDLLGGFGGKEIPITDESAAEGEEQDLETVLRGLAAHENANVIKADSIEQFYGTWVLVKVSILGFEVPQSEMPEGTDATIMIINENGIFMDQTDETQTAMELKDGILVFGEEDVASVHLTAEGICLSLSGLMDMDFVAAQ